MILKDNPEYLFLSSTSLSASKKRLANSKEIACHSPEQSLLRDGQVDVAHAISDGTPAIPGKS